MPYFLAKTDPESYSLEQLAQEGETTWDGVRNAQACRVIQSMRPGDRVFVYHSASKAAIVGLAEVTGEPLPDPAEPKSTVVRLRYVQHLEPPTSLKEIRETGQFGDWALIRQGRLSTMAAPEEFVAWMRARYPAAGL